MIYKELGGGEGKRGWEPGEKEATVAFGWLLLYATTDQSVSALKFFELWEKACHRATKPEGK